MPAKTKAGKPASTKKKTTRKTAEPNLAVLNVAFVLDMSGSMGSIRNAAVEGVNEYIRQLKEDDSGAEIRFSLTAFDTIFEPWKVSEPIAEVAYVGDEYQPRGNTALHDAIANTITEVSPKVKAREKALVVVLTDGQENSSREYAGEDGRRRLAKLVEQLEATGDWTFIYLGANDYDVKHTAAHLGVNPKNAVSYSATPASVSRSMTATAGATLNYASATAAGATGATGPLGAIGEEGAYGAASLDTDYRDEDDPTNTGSKKVWVPKSARPKARKVK